MEPTQAEIDDIMARFAARTPLPDAPLPDAPLPDEPVLISSFFTPTPLPIPTLRMMPDDMPDYALDDEL